jgi:hypothetical protein
MFGILEDMIDNSLRLNETEAWKLSIDREMQDEIIRLNTEDQLYEEGIDSRGRSLGEYSPYTIEIKRSKGDRYDHITLKDTGAFYASFKVRATKTELIIEADDRSKYDRPLTEVFGEDILGLTDDNLDWLFDFILEKYLDYVDGRLLP